MNKEAQEKIALKAELLNLITDGGQVFSWDDDMAEKLANNLHQLGYRKPLDRPKLRKEIAHLPITMPSSLPRQFVGTDLADQILALIPDIPKDKTGEVNYERE